MRHPSSVSTKTVFRVFWSHLRKYKWLALISTLAIVVSSVLDLVTPLYYKQLFDLLGRAGLTRDDSTVSILVHVVVIMMVIAFVSVILNRLGEFIANYVQPRLMSDVEQTSFQYLQHHSYTFFTNNFSGSLLQKIRHLSSSFHEMCNIGRETLLPLIVTMVGILIVVWRRSPIISLAILGWTVIYFFVNYAFAVWKLKYDEARAKKMSEATGALSDALSNSINIKLFSGYAHEDSLFAKVSDELQRMRTFGWHLASTSDAIQMLFMLAIEFVVLYQAIHLWQQNLLTVGDFVLLFSYLIILFGKLGDVRRVIRRVYESLADAKEMVELLELPQEIRDKRNAKPIVVKKGKIEFKDVVFKYTKRRAVLDNFDLTIKPGERVALVGSSGAGKTTVVKLLFRFFEINQGKLLIDGQSISDVTQDSLRDAIALVPQEPILFHRTLLENIRYGRRDATDEEVIDAARKAHCHEFISNSPEGYGTFVGERGIKLSGGERQRVAIARAILKNAPILVLDEATSSLDSESESLIQDSLRILMKDKTVIVIAHRLSTIMQMDRIIVMKDGKVIDQGTHDQLLQKVGIYQQLWSIQAGGFLA